MHRIQQPTNKTCGQTCIAMLANVTVEEVCAVMGKKGPTRPKDLVKALQHYKFDCSPMIRMSKKAVISPIAIIRLQHPSDRKWTHWVLRMNGNDYDPSSDVCALAYGWKLISFMEVRSHG